MRIIDTHVHFWDPGLHDHPWLQGRPALTGARLPRNFAASLGTGLDIGTVVAVEADATAATRRAETRWLSEPATDASLPSIGAIVAAVRLDDARAGHGIADQLADLRGIARVTGVRHNFQDLPDGGLATAPMIQGARAVAAAGLSFDACIRHGQLWELSRFAQAVPGLVIVLDHLGKPPLATGEFDSWAPGFRGLAACPNVYAKISGLPSEAASPLDYASTALPFVDEAVEVFGPCRLVLGSDWPVSTSSSADATRIWWNFLAKFLLARLPHGDAERIARLNATSVYRLQEEVT